MIYSIGLFCQASSLARESLLSITTQKTGSWFKEEIRTLGGLDHIVTAGKTNKRLAS